MYEQGKAAKTSANNSRNIEKPSENSYNVNKEGDNNGEGLQERVRGNDESVHDAGRRNPAAKSTENGKRRSTQKYGDILSQYISKEEYQRIVESPEFKAKDSSGKNILLFHATTSADVFDEFKLCEHDIGIHAGNIEQA